MESQLLDNDLKFSSTDSDSKFLNLRPNAGRAKAILILIWVILGIEVISLLSSGLQYNLLQTIANGGEITDQEASANDLREQIIAVVYLIAYISSGIVFIMWFRRAYFNLHQIEKNLSQSEGWAAGCWFVPIVNLYRPYQIMKELYVKTKEIIFSRNEAAEVTLPTVFLGIWWALLIINSVFTQITYQLTKSADTVPELIRLTVFNIIDLIIGIALSIVTIKVIRDYAQAEKLLTDDE